MFAKARISSAEFSAVRRFVKDIWHCSIGFLSSAYSHVFVDSVPSIFSWAQFFCLSKEFKTFLTGLYELAPHHFFNWAIPGLFFSLFSSFQQLTVNMFIIKSCRWLELNRGHLVLEATALPTEPQPLLPQLIFEA